MVKVQRLFAKTNLSSSLLHSFLAGFGAGGAQETGRPRARCCARAAGRGCLGTAPVNSVYVFDDRVVLNINFTDDAKMVTREEVLGSSAMDNVPACFDRTR